MHIHIRPAQPNDAAGVVAVFNPIILAGCYTTFDHPFSIEAEHHYIQSLTARDIFHVAVRVEDERIVGFQSMSPYPAHSGAFAHVGVLGTYVDLACRRQGISRQLFAATLPAARLQGYEKIFTYIRADNPEALSAYLHQGFRVVGTAERQACLNGQYVDQIIIERLL